MQTRANFEAQVYLHRYTYMIQIILSSGSTHLYTRTFVHSAVQRQTAVTARLSGEQLLLYDFAL